jgi:NDP-sugar pyrophosphorylase family protein
MDLKGVVLAGGTGSRLMPLTKVTNKHLLPIGRKPMVYYPIEKLASIGVEEILVVTGIEHMGDVVSLLGSGSDFGCRFTYKVQDEAGGIAQALGLAENFSNGLPLIVILGDNIFQASLKPYAEKFVAQKSGARILLKRVPNPQRFGVAEISAGKVIGIEESRPGRNRIMRLRAYIFTMPLSLTSYERSSRQLAANLKLPTLIRFILISSSSPATSSKAGGRMRGRSNRSSKPVSWL